jgi:hypothetical protein
MSSAVTSALRPPALEISRGPPQALANTLAPAALDHTSALVTTAAGAPPGNALAESVSALLMGVPTDVEVLVE